MAQGEGDDDFEEVARVELGEYVQASLKVRVGGKQPMAQMECKVVMKLDKIDKVPGLIIKALDDIYTQAQEKNLLGF